ncbi:hypothetical protein FB565_000545 [Actinoplanes lutulentus]|uniref:Uncharacterized protein n=1 Tax=Actinoplanes lutulentus TaxID=1287878 RepID=A0A327ZL62_9ACTN|nr:hypothetical protein [Actinoplanes lutulentus]MBB2940841.1 hypothetical protein [Actinoplanes lutulentus]RAK43150.1 hypothetical protein B0I29_101280 [Actinoplanes lutulentus]
MSLEDDLRIALHEHAAEPAPHRDLWEGVTSGVRRDRRRRAVLATGAAVVAITAVATVPAILAARDDRSAPIMPATPAPSASSVPAIDWVWPIPAGQLFPREPGWVPGGLGEPTAMVMGANRVLHYEQDESILEAEVGPIEPSWESEGEEDHTADVGGRPATVRTASLYDGSKPGEQFVGVRWRAGAGEWMQVLSWGDRDEDEILRFARELKQGSGPGVPDDLAFALVPSGFSVQHQSEGSLCVAAPEVIASERQPAGLCVYVVDEAYQPVAEAGPEHVTIGGRPATYYEDPPRIDVDLGGGKTLNITWDAEAIPLTRAEAIRFAEGVTVR